MTPRTTSGTSRSVSPRAGAGRRQTRSPRAMAQGARVLELSPQELRLYLAARAAEGDDGAEGSDEPDTTAQLEDDEAELELQDEDAVVAADEDDAVLESSLDDEPTAEDGLDAFDFAEGYVGHIGSDTLVEATPFLIESDVYALRVIGHADTARCVFEPPPWVRRAATGKRGPIRSSSEKLIAFLAATARWLATDKQAFLATRTADAFAEGERDYWSQPIVNQACLVDRVNARLPEALRLSAAGFSRLKDKVWLLWTDSSMPLQELFSEQYRLAWAMAQCMAHGGDAALWQTVESVSLPRKELKNLRRQDIGNMSRGEILLRLSDTAGIRADRLLELLKAHAAKSHGA